MVTIAGNPVLSTPDGARPGTGARRAGLHGRVDIYLNETTRHADVILPPTSALERDQYDLVFHGLAVRNTARFTPAVFAKPDDARHDWEIFRRARRAAPGSPRRRAQGPAGDAGPGSRSARRAIVTGLLRPAAARRCASCARTPRASTSARCARRMPERLQTARPADRPGPGLRRRRPRPASREPLDGTAPAHGRAAAHRPPAPAGLQLLDAQHRAADPRQAAAPAARCTPTTWPTAASTDGAVGPGRLAGRQPSTSRCAATDDMMPGVVSLPHGYGHQVGGTRMQQRRDGRRRLDQRPHRPRAPGRRRQRRAQRRSRDGPAVSD